MEDAHHDTIYATEQNHWWYRVRRCMVHDILRAYGVPRSDAVNILDVGCGTGLLMTELKEYNIEGIDVSPRAVAFCKERGLTNVTEGSAEHIPRPDNQYDVILALDVIEHIKDDLGSLREMKRVLKPGGYLILFVPAFMFLWSVTDDNSHHFRRYTREELCRKVEQAGLRVARASYFNTILFPAIAGVRLLVRALGVPMRTENTFASSFNGVFYALFRLESILLRVCNLPFGVSVLVVARKT